MRYYWNPEIVVQRKDDKYLFINPHRGSWLKVSRNVKNLLDLIIKNNEHNNIVEGNSSKILSKFLEAKIILDKKENNYSDFIDEKYFRSIYFILTKKCNLKCDFCCMCSGPDISDRGSLSFEDIKNIVDSLKEFRVDRVILTGGEPMLRKDLLDIIYYFSHNLSCKITLATNGLLLSDSFIESIKDKVYSIDISIENIFEKEMQPFKDELIRKVSLLKQNNIKVGYSYVLTRENSENILRFIDMAVEFETSISIKLVSLLGRCKDNKHLLMNENEVTNMYKKIFSHIYGRNYDQSNIQSFVWRALIPRCSCSAKDKILGIYPDGNVFSCHSLCYPEFYLGNILNDGPKEILNNQITKKNTLFYRDCFDIDRRNECHDCNVKYFCNGACFAELHENKELQGKLPSECTLRNVLYNFLLWNYNNKVSFSDNLRELIRALENISK